MFTEIPSKKQRVVRISPAADVEATILQVPEDQIYSMAVFPSYEGEGFFVGMPRVFARVSGCTVGCANCDTKESWKPHAEQLVHVTQLAATILNVCATSGIEQISITGGEPLHYPKQLQTLVMGLRETSPYLRFNLETSGVIFDQPSFDCFHTVSIDIKTPSTGVVSRATISLLTDPKLWRRNHRTIYVKSVIASKEDLDHVAEIMYQHTRMCVAHDLPFANLSLTPAERRPRLGKVDPNLSRHVGEVFDMVTDWLPTIPPHLRHSIRVVPQLHKTVGFL